MAVEISAGNAVAARFRELDLAREFFAIDADFEVSLVVHVGTEIGVVGINEGFADIRVVSVGKEIVEAVAEIEKDIQRFCIGRRGRRGNACVSVENRISLPP